MSTQRFQIDQVDFNKARPKLLYITESKFDHRMEFHPTYPFIHGNVLCDKGPWTFKFRQQKLPVKEDQISLLSIHWLSHTERGIESQLEYIVMGIEGVTFFSKEEDEEQGCSIANYYEYKHEVLFYLKTILMEVKARDAEYQSLCQNLLEVLLINLMRRANISLKIFTR